MNFSLLKKTLATMVNSSPKRSKPQKKAVKAKPKTAKVSKVFKAKKSAIKSSKARVAPKEKVTKEKVTKVVSASKKRLAIAKLKNASRSAKVKKTSIGAIKSINMPVSTQKMPILDDNLTIIPVATGRQVGAVVDPVGPGARKEKITPMPVAWSKVEGYKKIEKKGGNYYF